MKKTLRVDPGKECKKRVNAIKLLLPICYKEILFQHYPEYNTDEGRKLLTNVINLRAADLILTEILEKIAAGAIKLKTQEFEVIE